MQYPVCARVNRSPKEGTTVVAAARAKQKKEACRKQAERHIENRGDFSECTSAHGSAKTDQHSSLLLKQQPLKSSPSVYPLQLHKPQKAKVTAAARVLAAADQAECATSLFSVHNFISKWIVAYAHCFKLFYLYILIGSPFLQLRAVPNAKRIIFTRFRNALFSGITAHPQIAIFYATILQRAFFI